MFLISILLILTTLIVIFLKYVYSYWKRKGYRYIKPSIPAGNLGAVTKGERSFGVALYDLYNSTKEPFIGIYMFFRPALLIRDVELVKNVLIKDFNNFHDRGIYCNEKLNPYSGTLFGLSGKKWRTLRAKLTPTFTSGKLKSMFHTIETVGKTMQEHLEKFVKNDGKIIEMKEFSSRYVIDIIASVMFGLDVNSIDNPDNEFCALRKLTAQSDLITKFRRIAIFLCPQLEDYLRYFAFKDPVQEFMIRLVKETVEHREQNNVFRKDFMQLLIQLRNTGTVGSDGVWTVETVAENIKSMSIEQCAGQLFLFYVAGFETSSSGISYCLYEITQNPSLMIKLQEDIDTTLKKHNGQLTYDCIQDMHYLELCLMETTRKYPGLPMLNRECTETYNIPGTDHVIEKGTAIIISLMGLHRDPNYFPEPLKFDPERFTEENQNYNPDAYMPFGDGPRACIAFRMGNLIIKVGLIMLLTKFKFEALEQKELEFQTDSVGLLPKDGINLKVMLRD